MDNSVYLLSRNRQLIKCFLNYECMEEVFTLRELSTSITNIHCDDFNPNDRIIIVLDQVGTIQEQLQILKYLHTLERTYKIAILYYDSVLSDDIMKVLATFKVYKLAQHPISFFAFMNWLQKLDGGVEHYNIEREIQRHLQHFEVSMRVLGFHYLKDAVTLKLSQSKMKLVEICDKIAREHQTTSSRVERCMRTALGNGNEYKMSVFIGLSTQHRVSCMDFIALLANHILYDHKE